MPKPQKFCIFCLGQRRSKEHIWPDWASDLIQSTPGMTHNVVEKFVTDQSNRVVAKPSHRRRQGPLRTKQVRAPCETCNNGWMGQIEERAKPVMTPLVLGQSFVLSPEACRAVAIWATLKAMVAEFEHDDPDHVVISQEERSTFYRYRSVPPGCRIWIASTDVQAWREQLFRFTGHLVTKPIPNSRPAKQNVQTITFGMGHLIIQIICAETERLIEKIGPWYEPDLIKPVWPVPREGIRWPPARNLSAREIAYVGTILSDLKGAPSPKS